VIPDGCRLRLGMTNPPYILDHLDEMAEILNNDKVYSFLHVPVQSGSDPVLLDMKREYTVEHFCRVVDTLRSKVPGITIITDIICGFPTEMEEDFESTLRLCEKYEFPSLFINQFFPRPGTPAAKMKRVPTHVVKNRTRRLTEYFRTYSPYTDRMGKVYTVLVTETSHDGKYYVGHNQFYEQVLVPKLPYLMGRMFKVKIVDNCKFSMTGELVAETAVVSPALAAPLDHGQVSGVRRVGDEASRISSSSGLVGFSCVALMVAFLLRLLYIFRFL